jgi:hypothetical protein
MRKQRGVALLAVMTVLALGASWYLISALNASPNRTAANRVHNADAMQLAKQALLGWVVQQAMLTTEDNPGRLPCPEAPGWIGDPNNEGTAAANCTLPALGRLPWRTLGLPKLIDAAGEPLWYAVSAGWALPVVGTTLGLNSNSSGQLTLDGSPAAALIIAPGGPINVAASANCTARTQQRPVPSATIDLRDYLECQNASSPADASFAASGPSDSFNDQVLALTAREVWDVVEGPVAARILRDVVPQLATVYNSSDWSASATNQIFPYAAPFADASTSPFKGVSGTREGLLPFTRAQNCNPATESRCDPDFVQWDTASISLTQDGGTGTISSSSCAASTPSTISCNVTFERTCFICSASMEVRIRADALRLAMTFKTLNAAAVTGTTSTTQFTAPIRSDTSGTARIDYRGWLPNIPLCFGYCSATRTLTIPTTALQDHPLVTPLPTDAWYWFTSNNWHHVTYYAVSPSHLPDDQGNCTTGGNDCLTVAGGSPSSNVKALVVLAGRSIASAARPNGSLNDYLDSAENRDADRNFEQLRVSKTFNDRVVSISNY